MEIRDFFMRQLCLAPPWSVEKVLWDDRADSVDVLVECSGAGRIRCPLCDRVCSVTGFGPPKRWRHADTCLKKTFVHAAPPQVDCPEHGKLECRVPWAPDLSSSFVANDAELCGVLMTMQFEKWLLRLARTIGDPKKAAFLAKIDYPVLQHLVRSESRQKVPAPSASLDLKDQGRQQLSLFAQGDLGFLNQAIQAFGNLDLREALSLFQKHRIHYPKVDDVSARIKIVEFLLDGLARLPLEPAERPGYLCNLWDSCEDLADAQSPACAAFASKAKVAYFARALREIRPNGNDAATVDESKRLAGFMLLQAGRYEEAIGALQECILRMPETAVLYGWLADAYLLRGDPSVARQCYREACYIDPSALDWRHLQDAALKELKQDIQFIYCADPELAIAWLPGHARIEGLFEPKIVRVNDGLKEMVESYLAVERQWRKNKSQMLAASLFAKGIVLSENRENLKFIKKIDLIEVRRIMKQVNPDLFEEFLKKI